MIDDRRKKLAQLSFTEKIKLLEKLRDRSLAFAEARKKLIEKQPASREVPGPSKSQG